MHGLAWIGWVGLDWSGLKGIGIHWSGLGAIRRDLNPRSRIEVDWSGLGLR